MSDDTSAVTAPKTDRREFLRRSSVLVASSALWVSELTAAGKDDEHVRVAVVGTGGRGSDLIRTLTTIDRAQIVAVCDNYPPHLERGMKYAGPQARGFSDYTTMLREIRPDALVVATPLHMHFEMCMEALPTGCAIFCEKTMCRSIEQARELAAAVHKHDAVFQVGLQRRANAIYQQAVAMVQTGMLGQIGAIKCQWHRNNNWRRPVPVKRGAEGWEALEHRLNWRLYPQYSGGLMTELASHQLDVVNWVLGRGPRRVIGSGGIDYWRDGREVFDNVFCIYEYEMPADSPGAAKTAPSGPAEKATSTPAPHTVRVTYSSIQNNAFEGASELIMGTRGTLLLTQKKGLFYRERGVDDPGWAKDGRVKENAKVITSGKTLKLGNDPWAHRGLPFEIASEGDDTRDELVAFLQCAQHRDPATICDARHGLLDTETVLTGNLAMERRTAVEFHPQDPATAMKDEG